MNAAPTTKRRKAYSIFTGTHVQHAAVPYAFLRAKLKPAAATLGRVLYQLAQERTAVDIRRSYAQLHQLTGLSEKSIRSAVRGLGEFFLFSKYDAGVLRVQVLDPATGELLPAPLGFKGVSHYDRMEDQGAKPRRGENADKVMVREIRMVTAKEAAEVKKPARNYLAGLTCSKCGTENWQQMEGEDPVCLTCTRSRARVVLDAAAVGFEKRSNYRA